MQNVTMKQPPNVISSKDMNYIEDMLAWNMNAAKTARDAASKVTDQEIKDELQRTYQMHKKHYDQLLSYLQNNQNMTS